MLGREPCGPGSESWQRTQHLACSREKGADEASSLVGPRYVSLFSRRTADGPKRKPLPWRRRWHWLRSSCEPDGRSRKSAARWAVSGELGWSLSVGGSGGGAGPDAGS